MTKRSADPTHPNRDAFPPGLSGPALRALHNAGVAAIDDLTRWREREVASLHGMGPKGIRTLRAALAAEGKTFSPS